MIGAINQILFGDTQIREYATVTVKDIIREKVYLKINETEYEVSQNQWLLCLNPAVFGVWLPGQNNIKHLQKARYSMFFTTVSASGKEKTIAALTLDFFENISDEAGVLVLLKVKAGRIHHLNLFSTRLLYNKYYKKPQTSFEQLKAFSSAYSYPRRVRIISFKEGDYYNIFPMDLLGEIKPGNKYVFGLRHTNTALAKIIQTGKIIVSEVPFEYKDTIYKLGSHHSSGAPPVEKLPFKVIESEQFGFYVPDWVNSYKEISIIKTINLGSHMLLWGQVQNECELKKSTGHLFHIHYLLYLYQKSKGVLYPAV
ncbi:MAG: hypothetical protein AAGC65_00875 [Mucilaginibacter sp.]|uniref:hypothetical protein n=1 Tax=Mucilaginibacter sp. TaxID=1882438 RepID=UPI0031A7DDE2